MDNNKLNVVSVVVGVIVASLYYFGLPSFSDNILEKAVHVGTSDQTQFDAFKNKGGLENESTWKDFKVRSVSTAYDDRTGKLGILNMALEKDWPRRKLASIDNLKSALSSECGSTWTQNDLQRTANMHVAEKDQVMCAIQDAKNGVLVSIAKK